MLTVEYAEALMRDGDFDEAKTILTEILNDDPENLRAICNIGITFTETGENDKAIRILLHYVTRDVSNPYAWDALGCARLRNGEFIKARSCFTRSLDLKPDNPSSLRNLGILHGMEGRPEDSTILLERSLKLAPNDYRTLYAFAHVAKHRSKAETIERIRTRLLELPVPDEIRREMILDSIHYQLGWS